MPGVFIGSTEITDVGKIKIGSTDVQEIYVGSTKIWPSGAPVSGFVTQWKTDNAGTSNPDQITLPLVALGTYNFVVNWGDGSADDTITAFDDAATTHTFVGGAGTYTVTITGVIEGWRFNNGGDKSKLTNVSNWDTFKPGNNLNSQFYGCDNMDVTATDAMDTSNVTAMNNMFRACSSMTQIILSDTSAATNMNNMFFQCTALQAVDTTGWDLTNVTNLSGTFSGCTALTSLDLTGITASSLTNMNSAFFDCGLLTALDVSGFNTTLVTDMASAFRSCGNVTSIDVSGFSTANVGNFNSTFRDCSSLAVLNVSGFDTSSATQMGQMFFQCVGVTTLAMDAVGWDINQVNDMNNMCTGMTLATANYDLILAAWAAQTPLQNAVPFHAGNSTYTIATSQANRDVLTDPPNSWVVTDGGGI